MSNTDNTRIGPDGIARSFDEHYDTIMDVEQDATGAHDAIHSQAATIEALQAENERLRDALIAVKKDLLMRAKTDPDGTKAVAVGSGVWGKVCAALAGEGEG